MTKIKTTDEKYSKIVNIDSEKEYDFDLKEMDVGEEVECPFNKTMTIKKLGEDSYCIVKKGIYTYKKV